MNEEFMFGKLTLQDLLTVDNPAWPSVQSSIQASVNSVEVLPPDESHREQSLLETQVSVRSSMGALVYHTGGLLIDHGWLRVLASGHPRLPRSIATWNRGRSTTKAGRSLGFWLIADDVVGGFFALNGGAFGPADGRVFYFAPDTLRWESMQEMNYGQFLVWSLGPNLVRFYESVRRTGWESEVAALNGDQALSLYPPLWTAEGKHPEKNSRKQCPVDEIYSLNVEELPKQLQSELK
jgi:Protein of unknown function DUF2625